MPDTGPDATAESANRVHAVRLTGEPAGGSRGTILGALPLWFVHLGVTYIRTPQEDVDADGAHISEYRAVVPTSP